MEYKFDVLENNGFGDIKNLGTKSIYNLDGKITASTWVRKEIKGKKKKKEGEVHLSFIHISLQKFQYYF